jgi:hypothetical protein
VGRTATLGQQASPGGAVKSPKAKKPSVSATALAHERSPLIGRTFAVAAD